MKFYKSVTRKVNFGDTSFEVKVKIKYQWDTAQRLEECFSESETLTEMYDQIGKGQAMFITLLAETQFSDIKGSDCLGTVWIDRNYSIEDCIKENHMIQNAIKDLLNKMQDTYKSLQRVLA